MTILRRLNAVAAQLANIAETDECGRYQDEIRHIAAAVADAADSANRPGIAKVLNRGEPPKRRQRQRRPIDERNRQVLEYINRNPGATYIDISHALKLKYSNVALIVSNLHKAGKLTRTNTNPKRHYIAQERTPAP